MSREPLPDNHIFRECDARNIFGYSTTVLKAKIKSGDIPKPKRSAPPPSKAMGWFGWQVNEHHKKIEAEQAAWEAEWP
jgi:hypothetical protein